MMWSASGLGTGALLGALSANGDKTDLSGFELWYVIAGVAVLAVVGGLASLPIFLALRRNPGNANGYIGAAILWGLFSLWTGFSFSTDQLKWSKERMALIESGYYDPRTKGDGPPPPWLKLEIAAAAYALLVAVSIRQAPPAGPRAGGSLGASTPSR